MQADLLIYDAAQVLTLASPGGPKRGPAMGDLGIIPGGAVAIRGGRVLAAGPSQELRSQVRAERTLSAAGRLVMPGFVDPHTHLVWAGERAAEFEMRVGGASYMEIMAAGGGLMNTVRQTRAADVGDLVRQTRPRLARMLARGTTTVEIKIGCRVVRTDRVKEHVNVGGGQQSINGHIAWRIGGETDTARRWVAAVPSRPIVAERNR